MSLRTPIVFEFMGEAVSALLIMSTLYERKPSSSQSPFSPPSRCPLKNLCFPLLFTSGQGGCLRCRRSIPTTGRQRPLILPFLMIQKELLPGASSDLRARCTAAGRSPV